MALEVQLAQTPEAWELETAADLFEAFTELPERGFRVQLSCALPSPSADAPVQELRVNRENDPEGVQSEVVAVLGDRLLLANGILRRLSVEELAAVTA